MKTSGWIAVLLCAGLAGCGGGGGSSSGTDVGSVTPASLAAQGIYQGTTSSGKAFDLRLLEDGTYYTLVGNYAGQQFQVTQLVQGSGTQNAESFSSSDTRDYLYTGQVISGSLSSTVNPGASISGTVTEGNSATTFSGTPLSGTTYDYNAAPSLSPVVGNWIMSTLQGANASVTVNADGSFAGSTGGCSFSGQLSARSSGKNVFNAAVMFGPVPCALPNGTANGVALSYPIAGTSQTQLLVAAVDPTRAYATVLFGQR